MSKCDVTCRIRVVAVLFTKLRTQIEQLCQCYIRELLCFVVCFHQGTATILI